MTDLSIIDVEVEVNAIPTLNQTFTSIPNFLTGGVPITSPMRLLSDHTFQWRSGYIWEHNATNIKEIWPPPATSYPAWTSNGDADVVPNADLIAEIGINPYSYDVVNGLVITPHVMPASVLPLVGTRDLPAQYISGAITSFPYCQLYGVFSIVAKMPKGKGMWPAFWMLPFDKSWPPELDIVEVLGADTTTLYTTVHTKGAQFALAVKNQPDLSLDFHEYTVDWSPATINWYIDHKLIFTQPTPVDMHKPCYLLANLAVGKTTNWGGAPLTDITGNPELDSMKIKSIKAWQRPAYI